MPKPAPPQDVSEHPRALALLHWTRRAARVLTVACVTSLFLFHLATVAVSYCSDVALVLRIALLVFLAALLVFAVLHGIVVLVFFVRFSLMQIVAAVLFFGLIFALIVRLPKDYRFAPVFLLFTAFIGIGLTLLRQDPSGAREMPDFVKRVVANRLRERIKKRREQERIQQVPVERSSETDA